MERIGTYYADQWRWRPIRSVFSRLTINDIRSTRNAFILHCRDCGAEKVVGREEIEEIEDIDQQLLEYEAARKCSACGAKNIKIFLAAVESFRYQTFEETLLAPPRQPRFLWASVFVVNTLALCFLFRLGDANIIPPSLEFEWHAKLNDAFLAAVDTNLMPLGQMGHVLDLMVFSFFLVLAWMMRDAIVEMERCARTSFAIWIDRFSGRNLERPSWGTVAPLEFKSLTALFVTTAMGVFVFLTVLDNRIIQAGLLLALFFQPARRLLDDDSESNSITRFLVGRIGPMVFVQATVIGVAFLLLNYVIQFAG